MMTSLTQTKLLSLVNFVIFYLALFLIDNSDQTTASADNANMLLLKNESDSSISNESEKENKSTNQREEKGTGGRARIHRNVDLFINPQLAQGQQKDGHRRRNRQRKGGKDMINLRFEISGIENIVEKDPPAYDMLKGVSDNVNSNYNHPRGRRIHPRTLAFTRLEDFKKAWCQMDKAKIRVRARGCKGKEIIANFCYGQCTSIFIPRYDSGGRLVKRFSTCGVCQPVQWKTETVQLDCPDRIRKTKMKKVKLVTQCGCSDVNK